MGASAIAAGASNPREFTEVDALLGALRDGHISATAMTISDFTLAAKRYPGLQGGVFLDEGGSAAWGLRKDADALEMALNSYLANLRKGPSWSRLIVRYFGEKALSVLGRE